MSFTIEIQTATFADRQEWDAFVHSFPEASPYHLFGWGMAITQVYGHEFYPLLVRQDGRLVGILPLVHMRLPFVLNELVALPFCDMGNCLAVTCAVEERLLAEALQLGERLKTSNILLRGPLRSEDIAGVHFSELESGKVRMLLDLPGSSEALLAGLKSKVRSQVHKAEKNGVVFRWAGKEGISSFYNVFCINMRDLGSPVHSRKWFEAVMDQFGDDARIGLAEFEGKCIGVGLILSTHEQTAIPWASTLRQYNHLNPNMLLYWNCLKFAADQGRKTFDFGRSTEDEGTFRFKKQWGARPTPLRWYSLSPGEARPRRRNRMKQRWRYRIAGIWKTIPVPLANAIGPPLRKYINL